MRRSPSSWTTVLTQLGYKRKRRKRADERKRRSRLEQLEERAMLSATAAGGLEDDVAVVAGTVDAAPVQVVRPFYVLAASSSAAAGQFDVRTEYGRSGEPVAVIVLKAGLADVDTSLQELTLELTSGGYVTERHQVLIDLTEEGFVEAFYAERMGELPEPENPFYTTPTSQLLGSTGTKNLLTGAKERTNSVATAEDQLQQAERVAEVARRQMAGEDALESSADKVAYYEALEESAKNAAVERSAGGAEAAQLERLAGEAALASAEQIKSDLASSDPVVAAAARAARDELVASVDPYFTILTGLEKNQAIKEETDSWGRSTDALHVVEEGSLSIDGRLRIELGGYQALVQVISEWSSLGGTSALANVADALFPAVQDTFVDQLAPTSAHDGATLLVGQDATGNDRDALLEFDLSQYAGDVPTSAMLTITPTAAPAAATDLSIAAHNDLWGLDAATSWDETTLAWNDYTSGAQTGFGASFDDWRVDSATASTIDVTETVQRALVLGDSNLNAELDYAGAKGDVEAFYLAALDFTAYTAQYGGEELAVLTDGLVYRNDANLDGVVDATDAPGYFDRLGVSQGDFNLDGVVDIRDYALWSDNFEALADSFGAGDGDLSGVVDSDDYTLWSDALGDEATAPADPSALFRVMAESEGEVSFHASESATAPPELAVDFAPGVEITSFTAAGGDLQIEYDVDYDDALGAEIALYQVVDGVETELIGGVSISGTVGQGKSATVTPSFTITNPDQEFTLLARITSTNGLTTSYAFDGGVFKDAADAWFVLGTSGDDSINVSDASLTHNSDTVSLGGQTAVAVYVDAGAGADDITATPSDSVPLSLSGGWGDDTVTLAAATTTMATVAINDPAGFDTLDLTNWNAGLSSATPLDLTSTDAQGLSSATADLLDLTLGGDYAIEIVTGAALGDVAGPGYTEAISVSSVYDLVDGDHSLGELSLREALALATAITATAAEGDVVDFDSRLFDFGPVVIDVGAAGPALGHGQLEVDHDVTIDGPGAELLTISGGDASRIFRLNAGATVAITGLTIADGFTSGNGAGIYSEADLTLDGVVVRDNEGDTAAGSPLGGGVYVKHADLTILDSSILNNYANQGGGVQFFANDAGGYDVLIENSTIAGNYATNRGGGLRVYDFGTVDTVVTVVNTTVSGNSGWLGGGIQLLGSPTINLLNTTVTANDGRSARGGVYDNGSATITLSNSIVAGNDAGGSLLSRDLDGSLTAASSHNLVGNQNAGLVDGVDGNIVIGSDAPGLAPLADNGGPTETHAPLEGSLAIDAGSDALAAAYAEDQRGHVRVIDLDDDSGTGNIDIGAVEVQPPPVEVVDFRAENDQLVIEYIVHGTAARPLVVKLYTSSDGAELETELDAVDITDPALWAEGVTHTYAFTPDLSATDIDEDYYLVAGISYTAGSLINSDQQKLESGLFVETDGTVHLHGSDAAETITVTDTQITSAELLPGGSYSLNASTPVAIRSQGGDDSITASSTAAAVTDSYAGDGNDEIIYAGADGFAIGGDGDDILKGNGVANFLYGGFGNDTLEGLGGNDILDGGYGNDTYVFIGSGTEDLGTDTIFEPEVLISVADPARFGGVDTLDFSGLDFNAQGVTVDLSHPAADQEIIDAGASDIRLRLNLSQVGERLENIIGTPFDDSLTGHSGANRLDGGRGLDQLAGLAGDDAYAIRNSAAADVTIDDSSGLDLIDLGDWAGQISAIDLSDDSPQSLSQSPDPAVSLTITVSGAIEGVVGADSVTNSQASYFGETISVTTLEDSVNGDLSLSDLSLREALLISNAALGANTILINLAEISGSGQIEPDNGAYGIFDDVTIAGTDATHDVLEGSSGYRLFEIPSGFSAEISHLELSGGDGEQGGALLVGGAVSLSNVILKTNDATFGPGAYVLEGGSLTITDSYVRQNNASSHGGAIYNLGRLVVKGSQFFDNEAGGSGGAVYAEGFVQVDASEFIANSAYLHGGAITSADDLYLYNTTIEENSTTYGAAAINHAIGTLQIEKSSIDTNTILYSSGGEAISSSHSFSLLVNDSAITGNNRTGINALNVSQVSVANTTVSGNASGIYIEDQYAYFTDIITGTTSVILTNLTVANNVGSSADGNRGGVNASINPSGSSSVTLHNSIVADNYATYSGGIQEQLDVSGTFSDFSSNNLIGVVDGSTGLGVNSTLVGNAGSPQPAGLGPLAFNGGPTHTHALMPGSAAIDAGDDALAPETDQRGEFRIFDSDNNQTFVSDIGAYELVHERVGLLPDGTLIVNATEGDDEVYLGPTGVTFNGQYRPFSYGANDVLLVAGLAGHDVLVVEEGVAFGVELDGGEGDDTLTGGAGQDTVRGGPGNDLLRGGDDVDFLYGGEGDDVILGEAGNDVILGDEGADELFGGDGADTLQGGLGSDTVFGGPGADILDGGEGGDTLTGDEGADQLFGGIGIDALTDDGVDALDEGTGETGAEYDSPEDAFAYLGDLNWTWDPLSNEALTIPSDGSLKLRYELQDPRAFADQAEGGWLTLRIVDPATGEEITTEATISEDTIEITPDANETDTEKETEYWVQVSEQANPDAPLTWVVLTVIQHASRVLVNEPPVVEPVESISVRKDQGVGLRFTAEDDYDWPWWLTYENVSITGGSVLYQPTLSADGVFRWEPEGSDVATYTVTFDVRDLDGAVTNGAFTITLEDFNEAPPDGLGAKLGQNWRPDGTFTNLDNPVAPTLVQWGPYDLKNYTHDLQTDDGDLTFSIASGSLPDWMTLSPDGVLSGSHLSDAEAGLWTPIIKVTDENIGGSEARSSYTHFYVDISHTELLTDEYDNATGRTERITHTRYPPVYEENIAIDRNEDITLADGSRVEFQSYFETIDETLGVVHTQFTGVSDPSHAAVGSFDLIDFSGNGGVGGGLFTYSPGADGEGLDQFSFSQTHPYAFPTGGQGQYDVWIETTVNTATEYIEVGHALRADIDIALPGFGADAVQEKSDWHTYDETADESDELLAAFVGYDERVPLQLGYWLREDAFSTDFTARVTTSGDGAVTFWDAEEGGNEIFAYFNGGTEWIIGGDDDLPSQIWVQGAYGGSVDITLSIEGPKTSLFTEIPAPHGTLTHTWEAGISDADTVSVYVGASIDVYIDTDAPECSCTCTCSTSPAADIESDDGHSSVSAPVSEALEAGFISPQKYDHNTRLMFTEGDLTSFYGSETEPHVHLLAPGSDLDNLPSVSDSVVAKLDPIDVSNIDSSAGVSVAFVTEDFDEAPSGYYLSYVELGSVGRFATTLSDTDVFQRNAWTPVVRLGDFGFGDGWNIGGLERLIARPDDPNADKIYWMRGDNELLEFEGLEDASGEPVEAEHDPNNTEIFWDENAGTFELVDKYNNRTLFDSDGWITARIDSYGNQTLYTYTGDHKLSSIETDIDGNQTLFHWDAGYDRVEKIEDFAGRVTVLNHGENGADPNHLTSIELPDPTGAVAEGGGPTNSFAYDNEGRITSFTDADGVTTSFSYSNNGQVVETTYGVGSPDEATTRLVISELPFVTDVFWWQAHPARQTPAALTSTHTSASDLVLGGRTGSYTDELGRVTSFETDLNGYVTVVVDPTGRLVATPRDEVGRVTSTSVHDAEGRLVDFVDYEYDPESHDLLQVRRHDVSAGFAVQVATESYTYDEFSRPLTAIDEIGRVVKFDYDPGSEYAPGAASQITTRVVVGADDALTGGIENDDLVTFTYLLANGLVDYTKTKRVDNDGTILEDIETHFQYTDPATNDLSEGDPDDLVLLKSIATVVSGNTLAYVRYAYDEYGNALEVSEAVDILGAADITSAESNDLLRTTSYEYDLLDRLTKVSSPEPGAGQVASVARFEYTATSRVENVIDSFDGATPADEIVMHYEYDGRHRVVEEYYNYVPGGPTDHQTNVKTTYAYDAASNLNSFTDPLGRVTGFEYDLLDRPVRITGEDPDGGGPLASPVSHRAYDSLGRLLAESDPNGNITRYAYDQRHRVTEVLSPLGITTSLAYDDAGQITGVTDPEGRTTSYTYDDAGRLTSVILPGQSATPITYEYDTLGNARIVTDQLGRETHYEYDLQSRLERTIFNYTGDGSPNANPEENLATEYAYLDDGLLASFTELIGWDGAAGVSRTTSYDYDAAGRLATVTLPAAEHDSGVASPELHYRYDGFGNLQYEVDPLGLVSEYQYDKLHRPTSIVGEDPDGTPRYDDATGAIAAASGAGPVVQYVYDAASQLTSTIDPLDRETRYDYDQLGRLVRTVAPDPADGSLWNGDLSTDPTVADAVPFTRYEYDPAGNMTASLELQAYDDQTGDYTFVGMSYAYDALHRPIAETDAEGGVTTYSYDKASNLTLLTDPVLNTTSWTYDELNRVVAETNQLGDSRTYVYDVASRLTEKTDRNGRVTTYDYDGVDRPTAEHWYADAADQTADHTITYTYDHAGRLLSSTDAFHDYTFTYDDLDRLADRTVDITGLTPEVAFDNAYDVAGRLVSVAALFDDTGATADDYVNFYRYDNLHRPTGITQVSAGSVPLGDHDVTVKHVDFDYDLAGQLETMTRFTGATIGAPGFLGVPTTEVATTAYAYDGAGRLATIEHFDGADADPATGTLLAGYGYTFDHRSRLTEIDFLPGNAGYTSAFDYSSEDVTYTYDEKQQLEGADYAGAANDEAYQYDANGNRTDGGFVVGADNRLDTDGTYTYTYDPEGKIIRRDSVADNSYTVYDWDHRNRLIRVTDYDDQGAEASRIEYAYDAGDDLIHRRVFLSGGATPSESQVFVYDGGQIVLELDDDSGADDLDAEDLAHRYLWGPGVNHLLVDEAVASLTDASLNERRWALNDHLGTIRDWAADDGALLDHAEYDSYGQRLDVPSIEASIAWTGAYRDPRTGLQRHGARWYNPQIGRWMSQDYVWDGVNRYAYSRNQPSQRVDPDGLTSLTRGSGHHIITWEIITDTTFRFNEKVQHFWNSKAARLFGDWYSFHDGTSQRGISHDEYNKLLRGEFKVWFQSTCKHTNYSELTKLQAEQFLAYINSLPADRKIAQFNAAIRAEVELAAALGKARYDELRSKKRHWTKKELRQLTAQVKKELPDLVRKGAQNGKLASTIQRLKKGGYLTGKVAMRLGALGVFVGIFYNFKPTNENIRSLVLGCTPLFWSELGAQGFGALFEFAKGSLDDSVVTNGMEWMSRPDEYDPKTDSRLDPEKERARRRGIDPEGLFPE